MKENFRKLKEIFLKDREKNNNLFHIFHRCHRSGYLIASSKPIFQTAQVLCFSHGFAKNFLRLSGIIRGK